MYLCTMIFFKDINITRKASILLTYFGMGPKPVASASSPCDTVSFHYVLHKLVQAHLRYNCGLMSQVTHVWAVILRPSLVRTGGG